MAISLQTNIYHQLRKRRDKLNANDKKSGNERTNPASTVMSPASAKLELYDRWVQGIRDIKQYEELMPIIRPLLRADAKKTPGLVLYTHYPYLELKELVIIPPPPFFFLVYQEMS